MPDKCRSGVEAVIGLRGVTLQLVGRVDSLQIDSCASLKQCVDPFCIFFSSL